MNDDEDSLTWGRLEEDDERQPGEFILVSLARLAMALRPSDQPIAREADRVIVF